MRALCRVGLAVVCGVVLLGTTAGAKEKEKPDATLSLKSESVAIGIGYSWGSGVLHYKGKDFPFSVDGVSVGALGASKAEAIGKVYHLTKVEDINGTYTAASASATVGGGGGAAIMANQNGVKITLTGTSRGLKLKLAVDGVKIQLKQ
jgi:hypothetical protein